MVVDVERVAALEVRVDNLERWQVAQNGTLREINRKLDKTDQKIDDRLGEMSEKINAGLKETSRVIEQKYGGATKWVFGLLGSVLVSLVILVINLVARLAG